MSRLGILFCGLVALAACSSTAPRTTPTVVITDISNALTVLKADVALIPNLPPATVIQVQDDATKGLAVLAALGAEASNVSTANALMQAEGFLNAALVALPPVLPQPYNMYVAAAAAIIPTVEAYIASTQTVPVSGTIGVVAARSYGMSPAEGSAILAKAVKG